MPREQRRARGEHGREREHTHEHDREPDRERAQERGRKPAPDRDRDRDRERKRTRPGGRRNHGLSAREAALSAARQVRELTGRDPEGVTSLERREDGWEVGVEVVETHRVPDSTDILAEYRVEVDDDGELRSYRRHHRHYRGRSEERT
ncbi:gas vesicle protein [Streptomyces sp. NA02950]|uniref:gas vesicle protein GvpO n=1 Tax=Streptomyces sp. NA02950 TaxID=2742137 RepID=UPI001590F4D9|nr:gas vesicle protein GvpO [Streptomyces sp. NA02950]QKV90844.1 gas vesicle protein [Streptomyces sp. NA02950]